MRVQAPMEIVKLNSLAVFVSATGLLAQTLPKSRAWSGNGEAQFFGSVFVSN